MSATSEPTPKERVPNISSRQFGVTKNGEIVQEYNLLSGSGVTVSILNWGGIVRALKVPDRFGEIDDVVLGFESLEPYESRHPYFGSITGRYANRIARGIFKLDGVTYSLATNNGPNHLHGGVDGFDRKLWAAAVECNGNSAKLVLCYVSSDGEEGYPGELSVQVVYSISADNVFRIDYSATTTRPTIVNLTNHSYFNLSGQGSNVDVLQHAVWIGAEAYLPVNESSIPTGIIANVRGTPFDFTTARRIGERIGEIGIGYDHNYLLNGFVGDGQDVMSRLVARAFEPQSGRMLEVFTTEPGVQLYTGNYLDGSLIGKGGAVYKKHAGFCLETQHYPDSPNQVGFPSVELRPGELYRSSTAYRFAIS